jgi:hypothetical protein
MSDREIVLKQIKSRGHWRINFQPLVAENKLQSPRDCRDIMEKNKVRLRGWDYPYIPTNTSSDKDIYPTNSGYEAWNSYGAYKEFWRIYQSGQFIHYRALIEDWAADDTPRLGNLDGTWKNTLGIVRAIYQVTEIFEFANRLCRSEIYNEGLKISLSLRGCNGRSLKVDDPNRVGFYDDSYVCKIEVVEFKEKYEKDQLIGTSKELGFESIIYFFERFGWHKPNTGMIKEEQEKLLSSRFS